MSEPTKAELKLTLYLTEGQKRIAEDELSAARTREAALVAALDEAGDALVAVINYRDANSNHPLDGPITIQVDRAISRSRAALAATAEAGGTPTERP